MRQYRRATVHQREYVIARRLSHHSSYRRLRHGCSTSVVAAAAAAAARGVSQAGSTRVDTNLADWINRNGGSVTGAQLVYTYDKHGRVDRQLLASRDLSPGDRIIVVPRALQVRDTGTSDPRLRALMDRAPQTTSRGAAEGRAAWQFQMALQLIQYRLQGPSGSHHPYMQQLPGVADGVPTPTVAMRMSEEALGQLQNAALAADASGQAYFCREFAEKELARLPGSPDDDPFEGQAVTHELMSWGLACAMSRSFGFRQSPGHGMVPLVDMANHSFESNAEIRADESGTVSMIANKEVSKGAPLLLRYGTHSNADLLLSYGFVVPDNPFEVYTFPFDADFVLGAVQQFVGATSATARPSDGLKTWQRTVLADMGLVQQQQQQQQAHGDEGSRRPVMVSIGGDAPVQGPLLAACRVMLSEDRKAVKRLSPQELGDYSRPISKAHEALVMKALVGLCTVLYKSFPTSIQEDAKLVAPAPISPAAAGEAEGSAPGQPLPDDVMTAVQYRLAMKRGLEASTKKILLRMKEMMG